MGAAGTKETMDINLVKHDGDVETGGDQISINKDKNDATNTNENSDSDVQRPSLVKSLSIKTEVSKAIVEKELIRFGKYIMAWRTFPFRMSVALIVEFVIGFLAILSAKGDFQVVPTIVSMLYLLYLFSSSATQNTIWFISEAISVFKEDTKDWGYVGAVLFALFFWLPFCSFFTPFFVVLDLVNIHKECTGPHNLSFAAADTVTRIASINYASRATELSVAVPLLVSFDFLTKFSAKIIDSITCDEIKAEHAAKSYVESESTLFFYCVSIIVLGIVLTAVILACLSIGF